MACHRRVVQWCVILVGNQGTTSYMDQSNHCSVPETQVNTRIMTSEESQPLKIARIFELQDAVLQKNKEAYIERYTFIESCLELTGSINIGESEWRSLSIPQRAVYNLFHGDCFSTMANALRICLYGCETDACALMRTVLENLTVFDHINAKGLHSQAYNEIATNAPKGKPFSKGLDFSTAIGQQEHKDRRGKLMGTLSTIGSHLSPTRLGRSRIVIDGRSHVKPGASIDNPRINETLGELAALALFFVRVVDEFFVKYLPEATAEYHDQTKRLGSEYEAMRQFC